MKDILFTRWMHWKKHWVGMLFWLALPIIGTILISSLLQSAEKEAKVPIGIVTEDNTPLAEVLLKEIGTERTLQVQHLQKEKALHLLEIHKLDSVFVINKGFEEQIRAGNRDQLISGYHSDLSFAYSPVKEMIISLVQQETSRSKAAYTVKRLSDSAKTRQHWTWDAIVKTSKQVQKEENLFLSTFSYLPSASGIESNDSVMLDVWAIWALWNLLITFMLSDWLIKEKENDVFLRFSFIRFSYPGYLINNAILYFVLQTCFNFAAVFIFHLVMQSNFSFTIFPSLFAFQILLSSGAFFASTTI
ncbi:ABC transporter permease [Virgibacillus halophilus]|uniref:ABC transporter permease n=1 Tax=Tigheibacillus halophilus TaxID=361280 RepID=A0ABU5CC99_9BACI|nr:ABC transporter permease [Virgibacillus halophilus]